MLAYRGSAALELSSRYPISFGMRTREHSASKRSPSELHPTKRIEKKPFLSLSNEPGPTYHMFSVFHVPPGLNRYIVTYLLTMCFYYPLLNFVFGLMYKCVLSAQYASVHLHGRKIHAYIPSFTAALC